MLLQINKGRSWGQKLAQEVRMATRFHWLDLCAFMLTLFVCTEAIAQLSASDRPPRLHRFPTQAGVPALEFSGVNEDILLNR
jgi:hypothetical protein